MRKLVVVALVLLPLGFARAQFCPGAPPYVFTDVQANDPFCGFITRMAVDGITTGCRTIDVFNRLYCPNDFVTRKQMSAFIIRLSDVVAPLSCAVGQVMKWNGTDWVCANDTGTGGGGSGTVTQLNQGNGILLAPNPINGRNEFSGHELSAAAGGERLPARQQHLRDQRRRDGRVRDLRHRGWRRRTAAGQTTQTLRHDGSPWVASSQLTNDGTNIGLTGTPAIWRSRAWTISPSTHRRWSRTRRRTACVPAGLEGRAR